MTTLPALLRQTRKIKKLTLREVEEATGISNAYLSQLENGKIKQPSPQFLAKLSEFYLIDHKNVMNLAGYLSPTQKESSGEIKATALFNGETLTSEEEQKLREYLAFLRSQK